MKILVPIKQVVDPAIHVNINSKGTGIQEQGTNMVINPFCAIALEQAVRLKEQGMASKVVVVSIGDETLNGVLRNTLASGADRAILIKSVEALLPLDIAKLLKQLVEDETPELVLMGKQSVDYDNNQTGQMLAAMLAWPQGTFASEVSVVGKSIIIEREIDDGLQTLSIALPAVITADLRLNAPRFASLPNILKARSSSLDIRKIEDFNYEFKQRLETLEFYLPERRISQEMLESVEDLVNKLRNELKVI